MKIFLVDKWSPSPIGFNQGFTTTSLLSIILAHHTWICFLRLKSKVFNAFVNFKTLIENLVPHKIKYLQSVGGFKFMSYKFQNGIFHHVFCPCTPQQNSIVEQKHRRIIEIRVTLLAHALVPISYYYSTFQIVFHLINILLYATSPCKSPQKVLFHKTLNYTSLCVFGCLCFCV